MRPKIEAVIFDLGGVFVHVNRPAILQAIEARLGLAAGALVEALWRGEDWRLAKVGAITDEEYWRRASIRMGIKTPEILASVQAEMFGDLRFDPHMVTLVRGLRRQGYRVAMLSNASDAVGSPAWRARYDVDGLFDVEIVSARVGLAKPDPAIYRLTLDELGVAPQAAVFVDDYLPNIVAAADLGLQAIRFTGYEPLVAALAELGIRVDRENTA